MCLSNNSSISLGAKAILFRPYFILFTLFLFGKIEAQEKVVHFSGVILDQETKIPLQNSIISIQEVPKSTWKSNSLGLFTIPIKNLKEFHLRIIHLSCEDVNGFYRIENDTFITIYLHHYHKQLKEVEIKSYQQHQQKTIKKADIAAYANQNLSDLLEKETGVRSLKSGSGVSKPMINGLFGNRLSILNHGILQSGQQWGNDHAPEIDPSSSDVIRVIRDVSTLEYKGIHQGAFISLESKKIKTDGHIHGNGSNFFESNGRSFGSILQIEKSSPHIDWRLQGTFKKSGDRNTAQYFLTNTGSQEINFSGLIQKTLWKEWNTSLYLSSFNSELGILRGSHIGNLTDLNAALRKDVPFFTQNDFSYDIKNPRQSINHHLIKLSSNKQIDSLTSLQLTYAGQLNIRKEYDVRRGSRSEIPSTSISQFTNFLECKVSKTNSNSKIKYGGQLNYVENINDGETGVSPLIPNYASIEPSLYYIYTWLQKNSTISLGSRYDLYLQNIYSTTRTIPRENIEYQHSFHNISISFNAKRSLSQHSDLSFSSGLSFRNPAINELYSYGLHQGVSSIEEGNPELKNEISWKSNLSLNTDLAEKMIVEAQTFFHNINNFIYLNPQKDYRLTIRGAFPLFLYEQTHAQIYGFDIKTTYEVQDNWNLSAEYNYLRGWNLSEDLPLIFMPANTLSLKSKLELSGNKGLNHFVLDAWCRYIFKQSNLQTEQDFIPAPEAYFLLQSQIRFDHRLKHLHASVYLRAENAFNSSYRDYLNRFRYFADEMGRNIVLGYTISF